MLWQTDADNGVDGVKRMEEKKKKKKKKKKKTARAEVIWPWQTCS